MKRFLLLLIFCLVAGCAHGRVQVGDTSDLVDYVFQKAFGDNYGPVVTGETRGEYHDRTQTEEYGYIKNPYHGH